ncbi:hypothetical protein GOP47_0019313 [Adiantum capillus-veneris]|uniref:Uncharacterized protein n=1 Tax=Adiantum capillus-veneris TaxID=13818 RepID=A0A9D4UG12_ADICA|nr:hypothetical protein GOP47_0019313 [Adiantum capillus-veneris]
MANWLCSLCLLVAFCFAFPALSSGRSLHFSQTLIQGLDEPDPDAFSSELSFVLVETTSVELKDQEPLFSSLLSEIDPDGDFEHPNVPAHFRDSSIASILTQNGLPVGLLPSTVEDYTLSEDGKFSVSLSKACYVDFDYEVYYAETITGTLSYGAISDLSGIQAKKAFLWLSVTGIHADDSSSSYIYFDVGPFSKKLSISQFESVPVCKAKATNLSALA